MVEVIFLGDAKNIILQGFKWNSFSMVLLSITAPLLLFIKSKFLSPEEFGYIAVLTIFFGLLKKFEGDGLCKGIIQKDNIQIEEASSLFIFNLIFSLLVAFISFISSSIVAAILQFERIDLYIKLISLLVPFHGPSSFFRAYLVKFFLFKELAIIEVIRQLLLLLFITIFLFNGMGVLGFIYGYIIAIIVSSALYVYFTLKNNICKLKLYFNVKKLIFFLKFGIFTSGRSLVKYLSKRVDEFIIGIYLDAEVLGLYYFGKNVLEQLSKLSAKSLSNIFFPLFTKIKNQHNKVLNVYSKLVYYIGMISFPVFIGIAITAHIFIPLIFGHQWEDSVIIIQVFSITLILKMLTDNLSVNLLYSFNKPNIVLYIEVLMSIIYILGLIFFIKYGLYAVLIIYSMYTIIKSLLLQYMVNKYIKLKILEIMKNLQLALTISIIMIVIVLSFQYMFSETLNETFLFLFSVVIGCSVYLFLVFILDKDSVIEFYSMIYKKSKKKTDKS